MTKTELDKGAVFFGYTPTSQLALLTDAENQPTVYTYDALDSKLAGQYPDHVKLQDTLFEEFFREY